MGVLYDQLFQSSKRKKVNKMTEEQEEKRPVAHKRAIEMLKENPLLSLPTLWELYAPGTVVPTEDIPELIEAFIEAERKVYYLTYKVVEALKEQRAEAEKKEKKKEEATTS